MKLGPVIALFSAPAFAECPSPDLIFLRCQIQDSDKIVEVCVEDGLVVYRFGPLGAPELTLTETAADIGYTPWPGVGQSIWEEVRFTNQGHLYTVHGGIIRDFDAGNDEIVTTQIGGVSVTAGTKTIINLNCDDDQTEFHWTNAIHDAKAAAGLAWDHYEEDWRPLVEE